MSKKINFKKILITAKNLQILEVPNKNILKILQQISPLAEGSDLDEEVDGDEDEEGEDEPEGEDLEEFGEDQDLEDEPEGEEGDAGAAAIYL